MFPFCDEFAISARNVTPAESLQQINLTDLSTWASAKPAVSRLFQRSYPKYGPPQPTNLKVSFGEAPTEHLVFLFGIFMLISMVVICALFLMKMTKANGSSTVSSARTLGGILPSNYSMVLWMPKTGLHFFHYSNISWKSLISYVHRHHRIPTHWHQRQPTHPSLMLLLRSSFSCGKSESGINGKHQRARNTARGRSCVSVVSSSSMHPLLPHSLTITPSPSTGSAVDGLIGCCSSADVVVNSTTKIAPPPPYEELEKWKE